MSVNLLSISVAKIGYTSVTCTKSVFLKTGFESGAKKKRKGNHLNTPAQS